MKAHPALSKGEGDGRGGGAKKIKEHFPEALA